MSDLRDALHAIMVLCQQSRTYTRRTQAINDLAMRAVGMTLNQREERHMKIFATTGGEAQRKRHEDRIARRAARAETAQEPT